MNVVIQIFQLRLYCTCVVFVWTQYIVLCLCILYCVVFVFHQQWALPAARAVNCDERDAWDWGMLLWRLGSGCKVESLGLIWSLSGLEVVSCHRVGGRDSQDRRRGASLTCPEWETNILASSLYFYCICVLCCICVNLSRMENKYNLQFAVFLLYFYCTCVLYLYIVLICQEWEANMLGCQFTAQ